jgi:hypothetical protein
MSAVSGPHLSSHHLSSAPDVSVKPQVRLTLSFRQPSLTIAGFRGNVCGHRTDINNSAGHLSFAEVPLHSVFERALRDRVVTFNPCAHTKLRKAIKRKART